MESIYSEKELLSVVWYDLLLCPTKSIQGHCTPVYQTLRRWSLSQMGLRNEDFFIFIWLWPFEVTLKVGLKSIHTFPQKLFLCEIKIKTIKWRVYTCMLKMNFICVIEYKLDSWSMNNFHGYCTPFDKGTLWVKYEFKGEIRCAPDKYFIMLFCNNLLQFVQVHCSLFTLFTLWVKYEPNWANGKNKIIFGQGF